MMRLKSIPTAVKFSVNFLHKGRFRIICTKKIQLHFRILLFMQLRVSCFYSMKKLILFLKIVLTIFLILFFFQKVEREKLFQIQQAKEKCPSTDIISHSMQIYDQFMNIVLHTVPAQNDFYLQYRGNNQLGCILCGDTNAQPGD